MITTLLDYLKRWGYKQMFFSYSCHCLFKPCVMAAALRPLRITSPNELFMRDEVSFQRPKEFGSFSQDSDRQLHCDKSQLRYYVPPPGDDVEFDLYHGYDTFDRMDENVIEHLDQLLKWFMHEEQQPRLAESFVCWQWTLRTLMKTPYEERDGWIIAVTLYRGTYYMYEYETEERKRERETSPPDLDRICYGGLKFEQYITSDVPGGKPDISVPVNNKQGFLSVAKTTLNNHSLVYCGEVDCVDPEAESDNAYMELKTTGEIESRRQWETFVRFKLRKWWIQSYLSGVERIVAGFRDKSGTVRKLEEYKTRDLPKLAKNNLAMRSWRPEICLGFLNKFLDYVKETAIEDNPRTVYVYRPNCDRPRHVTCSKEGPDSQYQILPDWYISP